MLNTVCPYCTCEGSHAEAMMQFNDPTKRRVCSQCSRVFALPVLLGVPADDYILLSRPSNGWQCIIGKTTKNRFIDRIAIVNKRVEKK